jgi:hypothetical protein
VKPGFDMLDIDVLRATGAVPHWFGLGFVQLKLDDERRIHFWHPSHGAITPEDELHDHRYDFVSHVLAGKILHEVWTWKADDAGDHEMVEVSCKPGSSTLPVSVGMGAIKMAARHIFEAGNQYAFSADGFHRGGAPEGAITFLTRGHVIKDVARVIRPVGHPSVCPFSAPKTEAECWDIIAQMVSSVPHDAHVG